MSSTQHSEEAIIGQMMRRRRARDSLVGFAKAITIPGAPITEVLVPADKEQAEARCVERDDPAFYYSPIESGIADHHALTMEWIQTCIEQDYGRLMIFEPPGSAKSTYAAVVAPTWAMGKFPGLQVLMTSYAGVPIIRHSKRARQIVRSKEYPLLWEQPTYLVKGSESAADWELTNGSRLYAAGLQGAITSTRCDLGIIDDPVAGRREADSEVERRNVLQAYDDDFLTRLKPKASVILIQTRWHEDDLAGSILPDGWKGESGYMECRDGQVWRVLCLPAEANRSDDPLGREIGETLWKGWFTERHWATYRSKPRTWASLYQQDPQPSSGGQFERDQFHRFTLRDLPKDLTLVGTADLAVTKKQIDTHPDFTAMGCWGIDRAGDVWLFDGWHAQEAPNKIIAEWARLTATHKLPDWAMEAGVIRRAMEPAFNAYMEAAGNWTTITWFAAIMDKVAGVATFRGMASARKVHIIAGPFGDRAVAELCAFPMGRYDDLVDMCAQLGRFIDKRDRPERVETVAKRKAPKPNTYEYLVQEDEAEERLRREYMS